PRQRPSFPTRRSSDLPMQLRRLSVSFSLVGMLAPPGSVAGTLQRRRRIVLERDWIFAGEAPDSAAIRGGAMIFAFAGCELDVERSEEHTSELQSRRDL